MDTKSKKSKGGAVFAAYFIGIWLIVASLASIPYLLSRQFYEDDYTETWNFQEMMSQTLYEGYTIVTYNPQFEDYKSQYWDNYYNDYVNQYGYYPELTDSEITLQEEKFREDWEENKDNELRDEKENFYTDRDVRQVYFVNDDTDAEFHREYTNTDFGSLEEFKAYIEAHRSEYHYLVYLNQGQFSGSGPKGDFTYPSFYGGAEETFSWIPGDQSAYEHMTVIIAVREDLGAFGSYGNWAYSVYLGHEVSRYLAVIALCCFGAGLVLFILSCVFRKRRLLFSQQMAAGLSKIWLEAKIVAYVLLIALGVSAFALSFDSPPLLLAAPLAYWPIYLICLDFKHNGLQVFRQNSVNTLFKAVNKYSMKYPFQKRQSRKMAIFFGIEVGIAVLGAIFFAIGVMGEGFFVFLALLAAGIGLLVGYRFIDRYRNSLQNLGRMMDHVHAIREGENPAPLVLYPSDPLFDFAMDLNGINEGISKMVEERTKSERMKIELITNVSHDLKTPLTSIINYVDLLKNEELTPDFANDYVKVLERKSMRLKTLIEDLFEVSKANSGNMEMELTVIDFGELVEQTVAELDEKIAPSGLDFRVHVPQKRIHINADGRRLNRVLSNLILNAVKYSLKGTRVYIDVFRWEQRAIFVIKNIASYEMNFNTNEIMERFVRGDAARSTEGSGLGLSIAKSFTELMGGEMDIAVDGDLFKVTLDFEVVEPLRQLHQFPDEPPEELQ